MIKLLICIFTLTFTSYSYSIAQSIPKKFEQTVLSHPVDSNTRSAIFSKLNNGDVVTWVTMQHVIELTSPVTKRIMFIDSLLQYKHWEDEIKLSLVQQKLFYYQNEGSSIGYNLTDSLILLNSTRYNELFISNYYNTITRYADWNKLLARSYKGIKNCEKENEAYIEVQKVFFKAIKDKKTYDTLRATHLEALRERLACARGDKYKLSNILIPYTLQDEIFSIYQLYMKEVGETVVASPKPLIELDYF